MFTEMTVFGFTLDALTHKPVMLLKDAKEEATVPIWISSTEAVSIAAEMISRDLTAQSGREDLMSILLKRTGMSVERIAIDGFSGGVFTATVSFTDNGNGVHIKVRASEAIIASLKYKLPVMVSDEVVAQASVDALSSEAVAKEHDARRYVDFLENLKREDLGKYPM